MRATPRPGLTLLEMTIVLTILAVLTTLAITLTEGTVEQTRFDVTQRQLQNLQDAILGSSPDSQSFLADIGRLPRAIEADTATQLCELWMNPGTMRPFQQATGPDPEIVLSSGWRGPYIATPSDGRLRDGWGNPFTLWNIAGAHVAAGDVIGQVQSDRTLEIAPYNTSLAMPSFPTPGTLANPAPMPPLNPTVFQGFVQGTVSVVVRATSGTPVPPTTMRVTLYVPAGAIPTTGMTARNIDATLTGTEPIGADPMAVVAKYQYSFPDVTIGTVALRAYTNPTSVTDPRSGIEYLRVMPRSTLVRNLSLTLTQTDPTP